VDLTTGKVLIKNKFLFTNLNEYQLKWEIKNNGVSILSGSSCVSLEPFEETILNLGYSVPDSHDAKDEFVLTISFHTMKNTLWAGKGHEVAFEQFIIPVNVAYVPILQPITPQQQALSQTVPSQAEPSQPTPQGTLTLLEEASSLRIQGENFVVSFNTHTGTLISYCYQETEFIKEPLVPNFWRAYTDNDKGNGLPERCKVWREASLNRELISFEVTNQVDQITIKVRYLLTAANHSINQVRFTITIDGRITVTSTLIPGEHLPEIPQIGMMLSLPASLDQMEWYGKGPQENYWDRNLGAKLDFHQGSVKEQFVPYLRPQECGNKTDVRWARLVDNNGVGIFLQGEPYLEINALSYTPFELEEADHQYKLPHSDKVALRINYKQMGVGGDDTWGSKTHPEFTLPANRTYQYSFSIQGITN
jgi:beta-galactosidase